MTEQPTPDQAEDAAERIPGRALAPYVGMPAPNSALPTPLEWNAIHSMAATLATSDVVPWKLKRKPGDIAVVLLAAREYGIPALMALSKLPVVNGTPAPMGELMQALVARAGHRMTAAFYNPDGSRYRGGPITRQHYGQATYRRRDWPEDQTLEFSVDEALRAGLVDRITEDGVCIAVDDKGKPLPWQLYTPNMCRWRAVANAARLDFADVMLGLSYLPEELGALVDEAGYPIEATDEAGRTVRMATPQAHEERVAQENLERLLAIDDDAQLDYRLEQLAGHAEANGYASAEVTKLVNGAPQRMTFAAALEALRSELYVRGYRRPDPDAGDDVVEATVVEDAEPDSAASEAPQEAQEEPSPTPAPEATTPETGPQTAETAPAGLAGIELAHELARASLEEADEGALRDLWTMGAEGKVLDLDVIGVLGDDDLATLDAPRDGNIVVALGSLLMRVQKYAADHGSAVRDPGLASDVDGRGNPLDPWADGSAMGTPPAQQ